jgi:hypothetical protein
MFFKKFRATEEEEEEDDLYLLFPNTFSWHGA